MCSLPKSKPETLKQYAQQIECDVKKIKLTRAQTTFVKKQKTYHVKVC